MKKMSTAFFATFAVLCLVGLDLAAAGEFKYALKEEDIPAEGSEFFILQRTETDSKDRIVQYWKTHNDNESTTHYLSVTNVKTNSTAEKELGEIVAQLESQGDTVESIRILEADENYSYVTPTVEGIACRKSRFIIVAEKANGLPGATVTRREALFHLVIIQLRKLPEGNEIGDDSDVPGLNTPGFTLIVPLLAIAIVIILKKRARTQDSRRLRKGL
ncbi:MAG: hypothetical protein ACXADX_12095 [Candidatus Hodarchaeales archaeon]